MADILLPKTTTGALAPASEAGAEKLKRFKVGAMIRAEISGLRNYEFHKKWFALALFAFDQWSDGDMPTYKGEKVQPNFDRFRRDLTIMTGHGHPVVNMRGEVRIETDSIAFGSMDAETFDKMYSATIDVVLQKILAGRGYTEEKLCELVDQTMAFA